MENYLLKKRNVFLSIPPGHSQFYFQEFKFFLAKVISISSIIAFQIPFHLTIFLAWYFEIQDAPFLTEKFFQNHIFVIFFQDNY